jgi:Kef-type K+ transport system membrane component KefB
LIATALTAISIAISIQVLSSIGKMQTKEARLILGAVIVDDILAIAILSVVLTMVQTGNTTPDIMDVSYFENFGIICSLIKVQFSLFQEYFIESDYGNLKAV